MAKSSIKGFNPLRRPRLTLTITASAIAVAGGIAMATSSPSASPPAPALPAKPAPAPKLAPASQEQVPYATSERLARLDDLRAKLEEATLRRDLAKVEAEARQADAAPAATGGDAMPIALPGLPANINSMMPPASLNIPPLPPSQGRRDARDTAGSAGTQILEAWGSGTDLHARVSTDAGERIVRVGDTLDGGRITSITGNAIILDAHGKRKVIR